MGRNKFAQDEINEIARLLRLKNAGNRARQKLVRHDLRTVYEFNISDFNEPGKAFGEADLQEAIRRGAIQVLDDCRHEGEAGTRQGTRQGRTRTAGHRGGRDDRLESQCQRMGGMGKVAAER